MLFKVYTNRVNLLDDDGNIIAGIDFSKNADGICEIGNVYKNQPISAKLETKLMNHAIERIRSMNEHVVPTGQDARNWFIKHPKDRDLLDVAASVASEEASIKSQPADPDDHGHDVNFSKGATKIIKDTVKAGKASTNGLIKGVLHFLQAVCFICMLGILALYVQNALNYMQFFQIMIQSQAVYQSAFFAGLIGFAVWCLIQCIWILSKKNYIVDGNKVQLDIGRGITGFVVVLVFFFVSRYLYNTYGLQAQGVVQWLGFFVVNVTYIPYLSGIGLVLSILRRIISRI